MNKNTDINLANIPQELILIMDIIKSEKNNDLLNNSLIDIDWELFVQLAIHHRLYPILYPRLTKLKRNLIPGSALKRLNALFMKNTFEMLYLCGEMEQLSRLFGENGIRSLFLKGPVLAAELYGEFSLRTCGDLDILIPIDDLDKIDDLLTSYGYKKDEYIQTLLNDWKWRHHHFTYYHSEKNTKIEIHWRLNPAPGKEPSFNEMWERRRKLNFVEYPSYFLGEEDLFFFLVTHGARHGWSRLRWLVDINQMVKAGLKWETLNKILRKYHSRHIAGQSLILLANLMNTHLTKEMESLVRMGRSKKLASKAIFYLERMVSLHTDPVPLEISDFHSKHLLSLMSFQQKFIYLLGILHPYHTDAETLPLPKKLHFLYFPLRPFLWIMRKTRNHVLP